MKPISVSLIIKSLRSRVDGSISLTCETPELTSSEKTAFFNIQNLVCKTLIQPMNSLESPLEVKGEVESKTCSQRLRNSLFVWWKQESERGNEQADFESFYKVKMEKLIDHVKGKLD